MSPLIIAIAAFICVSALVGSAALFWRGTQESAVEDRLAVLTGARAAKGGKDAAKESVLMQPLNMGPGLFDAIMEKFNFRKLYEQAHTKLSISNFLMICGALGVIGCVVPVMAHVHAIAAPVIGGCCAMLPFMWLLFKRKRRFKKFAAQLPDALELVARALRAGHSLASGFSLVAQEMMAPIGEEFQRVFEEQNLGVPLEEAMQGLSDRIPNLDLRFFVTAVVLQRQTGGDLAEILDKIGYVIRERFKIWGQVQALTGEGRLSGIVLLALPPALFLAVYRLNPDYVMPLFTDPMGRQMLIGGIISQLLGALVIRKIINIRV